MVVECGFNMAASNTLSTVNGHVEQRRRGCGVAGGAGLQNNHNAVLSFHCQPSQNHGEHHQDSARLHSNGNCGETRQSRAEFLSAKDASRRKRVNRSAKLKQHKLDARREQWLSQGSQGKQGKAEQQQQQSNQQQHRNCEHHHHKTGDHGECMPQERAGPSGSSRSQGSSSSGSVCERTPVGSPATHSRSMSSNNEGKSSKKEAPSSSRRVAPKYFEDEEVLVGGNEHHKQDSSTNNGRSSSDMSNKSRSNSSCASSSYSTGSGSEDESPHDPEDDWESAFDALHVQSSPQHRSEGGSHKGLSSEGKELHDKKLHNGGAHHYNPHHPDMMQSGAQLKPEYKYKNSGFGGRRGNNGGRAWRPDDVSRPPTLPRLTKQHTYPNHSSNSGSHQGWGNHMHGNMWGNQQQPATPSYCPICTEELDMTDSSYMPCACGFQLCLFCYHRISSDDGRCPGCRKAYNPDSAVKLSRSSSVWLRV